MAPKANAVKVIIGLKSGVYEPQGTTTTEMTKQENDYWTVTLGPLDPNLYEYQFDVDGVLLPDPGNDTPKPQRHVNTSLLLIPGTPPDFLDEQAAAHGTVRDKTYYSTALGKNRHALVYTPPTYDRSSTPLPVLYLYHGFFVTRYSWVTEGTLIPISSRIKLTLSARKMWQNGSILCIKCRLVLTPLGQPTSRPALLGNMKVELDQPERMGPSLQESEQMLRSLFEFAPDAIAVLDRAGRIIRVNAQAERMFGYSREELVGQPVEMLMPERYRDRHTKHRGGYMAEPRTRPMGVGLELYGRRKDGTEFALDIMLSPVQATDAGIVIAVVRDITERKRAEQQIKESLRREALLRREIHHRVKNNLQVISSLLFLQSTHVTDPNTQEILRESQGRARAIALIHEKLYHSTDLTKIAFCDYVRQLMGDLFHAYGVRPEAVSLKIHAEGIFLGIDAAIPCGLILNELVSNALKHGLPAGKKGAICIDLQSSGPGLLMLSVRDDGVGLAENFDLQTTRTLGLKLVSDLARQLDGTVELERNNGTVVKITFAEPAYSEPS